MDQPNKTGWLRRHSTPVLITLGVAVVCVVAGVAGFMSWGHIQEVGHHYGEPGANLLPVSVDGMMIAGTVMGAVDHIRGYKTRAWSIVSLWLGSILTMLFNMASASERGPVAMGIAAIPAIALIVSVEAIFHPSRRLLETTKETISMVAAVATENVKKIVESTPESKPESAPVAAQAPAQAAQPAPVGLKGRRPGAQGKKAKPYRPNPQQARSQQAPASQQARRPVTAVMVEGPSRALPVASEELEAEVVS